jgi:hypothetical protein
MESVTRSEAIDRLRTELVKLTDGEVSACKLAADRGIFCRGFARFSDDELKGQYSWIVRRHPKMPRADLESIADKWQMARQEVDDLPIACDVQQKVHDTCNGWMDFSDSELSRFYQELTGKEIDVRS